MTYDKTKRGMRAWTESFGGARMSFLAEDQLEAIHRASMEVLRDTGVKVLSKEALDLFADGGAVVDFDSGIVKFPNYVVEEAISSAPASFLCAGRDPNKDMTVGENRFSFVNFGQAVRIVDPETREYRDSTKADLSKIMRLTDALEPLDFSYRAVCSHDVPEVVEPLHNAEAIFPNTTKHFFIGTDAQNVKRLIEMATVVAGSKDKLKARPLMSFIQPSISPLQLPPELCDVLIEAARAGIPTVIVCEVMTGATSPVTMAGSIVQHNAEVLSGVVLSQLTEKGAPVFYGSSSHTIDMRHASPVVGSPELGMFSNALSQMAKFYKLPCMMAGG